MLEQVNPTMLILARESRGMNQKEVAERMHMSVSNLSRMENNGLGVSQNVLEQIVDITRYPIQFFYQKADIIPDNLGYRKRQIVAQKVLTPINARINIIRNHVQFLIRNLRLDLPRLPVIEINDKQTPQMAATYLRKLWKLKEPIIGNMTDIIEDHGVVVTTFDFHTARVDSRSILTDDKQPVIVYNKSHLGDRQRFSLAHELGHLVMHTYTNLGADRDITHEANLFAAELLMPEKEVRKDFEEPITIPRLAELKKKWLVSMISLLYRADDLGYLSANQKNICSSSSTT